MRNIKYIKSKLIVDGPAITNALNWHIWSNNYNLINFIYSASSINKYEKEYNSALRDLKLYFTSQIAEKQSAREALSAEITSITTNMESLKADLKEKKTALKAAQKELTKLEVKKAAADQKAAEAAKKAEAEDVLKKLLASGVSADEILAKLK